MQCQAEFLVSLRNTADINLRDQISAYGLRVIRNAIEIRLPKLKPVAYENDDLSCGLSGGGIHHICGDAKSIARVRELMNYEPYLQLYREAEAKLAQGKVTYHLEIQSRLDPTRYVRQDMHHEELADAQDSAYEIKNFWARGRDVRIVKVTTHIHEEIVT